MASRLLGRYARVLCRASTQAPAAAAGASAHLPPPVAAPTEVLRAQGWPWATHRLMCERRTVTKEDIHSPTVSQTQLDEMIEKASAPEDILQAWEEHGGSSNRAANALIKWTQLMLKTMGKFKDQPPELVKDPRLLDMMGAITQEVRRPLTDGSALRIRCSADMY